MSHMDLVGAKALPDQPVKVERLFTFAVNAKSHSTSGGVLFVEVTEQEAKRLAVAYHRALEGRQCQ